MIQRLLARLRCLDVHLEILLEGFLSDIIVQMLRTKRRLPLVFALSSVETMRPLLPSTSSSSPPRLLMYLFFMKTPLKRFKEIDSIAFNKFESGLE